MEALDKFSGRHKRKLVMHVHARYVLRRQERNLHPGHSAALLLLRSSRKSTQRLAAASAYLV